MNTKQTITARTFTTRYNGLSNKLINEVVIHSGSNAIKVAAQWDTGATGTCIAQEIADQLNLVSTGRRKVQTPSGESEFDMYCVDLILPNNTGIKDVPVMGSEIGKQGIGVLIGMDIISTGDFAVSSYKGVTQFSFRIPSLSDADFTNRVDGFKGVPEVKGPKIQRNDPCPCGSGKKYKQCCGK